MQIFELHFNPKLREEQIFDSFIYEPENIYERRLGGLYIVGEIRNALPKSEIFLNNLARAIKKNYYTFSAGSPEKSLSKSLKKANDFLSEEVKNNNVSWLGNLNFAAFALNNLKLSFSKTGNLKILLIRGGQINDISKNLNLQDIEPYPLKIFFNVISGKLAQNDIILVLTKEIFEFFSAENTLTKIAKRAQQKEINEKTIKEIFPPSLFNKGNGSKISGICLLAVIKENVKQAGKVKFLSEKEKKAKKISFQQEKKFSLKQTFRPLLKLFRRIRKINPVRDSGDRDKLKKKGISPLKLFKGSFWNNNRFVKFFRKGIKSKKNLKIDLLKKIKLRPSVIFRKKGLIKRIKIKSVESIETAKSPNIKKILILIFILSLFLFFGFLIFKRTELKKENEVKALLSEVQEKIDQANNFLIFKNEEKANSLLEDAWREILPLSEKKSSLETDISSLKQTVEKKLKDLNKLEVIENPETAEKTDPNLFSYPSPSLVKPPSFEFNFDLSASYLSNIYFLDKKTCQIIKYSRLSQSQWSVPKKWMEGNSHCSNPKSMAVDGSVWLLEEDNSISRYYIGDYKETININLFPSIKNITKIKTAGNVPYLYLLEPVQKRIIITDKAGKIIKQFQSEKFDNLKDFAFSKDGKIIYLLNGLKIYQIKL